MSGIHSIGWGLRLAHRERRRCVAVGERRKERSCKLKVSKWELVLMELVNGWLVRLKSVRLEWRTAVRLKIKGSSEWWNEMKSSWKQCYVSIILVSKEWEKPPKGEVVNSSK